MNDNESWKIRRFSSLERNMSADSDATYDAFEPELSSPIILVVRSSYLALQRFICSIGECVESQHLTELDLATSRSEVTSSFDSTLMSANAPSFHIKMQFFLGWKQDPFRNLPVELIHSCLAALLAPFDRHKEGNLQRIQNFRLVCRQFEKIGRKDLFREIGRFQQYEPYFANLKHVNVIKYFMRYGDSVLPWMKKLHLRQEHFSAFWNPRNKWSIALHICCRANNVRTLGLGLCPPKQTSLRNAIMKTISSLPKLDCLVLAGIKEHGHFRWNFKDLQTLFQDRSLQNLLIIWLQGWDLLDYDYTTSLEPPSTNLERININDCKFADSFLEWLNRLAPKIKSLFFGSFWPTPTYESAIMIPLRGKM
ncbi:hypothetical protein BT69DRAFT_320604 [Atractiella rhizophila]|nr:hypothetical protein BT69DRAFT_320604 [Atractiella rhizophila]